MVTGLIAAGIGAAGGLASSAMGYYQSKKMAAYNAQLQYNNQLKGYKQFPSAQVEGLKRAGINPMVAYGGIAGADAHTSPGPSMSGPNLSHLGDTYSEAERAKRERDLAEKISESQIDANSAMAEKSRAEGLAALKNAETNAKNADINAVVASKTAPRDPSNSNWALGQYVTDGLGSLVGTGLGVKYLYDWFKGKKNVPTPINSIPVSPKATPTPKATPQRVTSKPGGFINTAKKVAPYVMALGKKALGYGALGYGAYQKVKDAHKENIKYADFQNRKYKTDREYPEVREAFRNWRNKK